MFIDQSNMQKKHMIDAIQTFEALRDAEKRLFAYRGSMYWQKNPQGKEYLVREFNKKDRSIVGPLSDETRLVLSKFRESRENAENRFHKLKAIMNDQVGINKALRIGRVPDIVIGILNRIHKQGLDGHFMVIGTNALFAYETFAGVNFDQDITSTTDCDFLWDSRKKVALAVDDEFYQEGVLGILKKVDKTFELVESKGRAINSDGYFVDLIKRRPKSLFDDKEKQQVIDHENDFWAYKIHSMDWLLSSPKFDQVVFGVNGEMANMKTVDPRAFVLYKTWLSQKDDREPIKKERDFLQAKAVFDLMSERLPQFNLNAITVFPDVIKKLGFDTHSTDVRFQM